MCQFLSLQWRFAGFLMGYGRKVWAWLVPMCVHGNIIMACQVLDQVPILEVRQEATT